MNLSTALMTVIDEAPDPIAKQYARAALDMDEHALQRQIPYILVNLNYWRGDKAREVKWYLRSLVDGYLTGGKK